jgi:hypothetical protein
MRQQIGLGRMLAVSAMLSLTPSCSNTGAGRSSCGQFQVIHPDPGFETRWTAAEKRQVLAHDEVLERLCGRR